MIEICDIPEVDMSAKKIKICFAASSGGHYEQIMMLKQLMERYDSFILTERTKYDVSANNKTYYLKQVNRKEWNWMFATLYNIFKSIVIYVKEKPDAIICTGALAMIPMCLVCKVFKKKLIFIESFAKVTSPTKTGKFLYKYADEFYVQWKSMIEVYPNAKYMGGIY